MFFFEKKAKNLKCYVGKLYMCIIYSTIFERYNIYSTRNTNTWISYIYNDMDTNPPLSGI